MKYYRYKLGIEGIVERSGLPWSVLRATQFHDLVVDLLRGASRLPVMTLPAGVSVQSIDTSDVAGRLIDMIAAGPQGRAADIGGPRIETVQDLAQQYLRAAGKTAETGVDLDAGGGGPRLPRRPAPHPGARRRHRHLPGLPRPHHLHQALSSLIRH